MDKRTQEKTAGRWATILLAWIAALVIVIAVGAFVLLSTGPNRNEQATGSGERPYVGDHLHSLAVDPTDPERVVVGGHDGAAFSDDGGTAWRQIAELEGADPMGWAIDPSDPTNMYAGGHPGFYRSEDGGESWTKDNSGLPGTDVHGLGIDPENPETLYAFIVKHGLYRSPDAGQSWNEVNARIGTMGSILVDPRNPDTLFLAGEDGLLRSTDGGETWRKVGEIPGGMATWISQDRQNPDTFYAAVGGRVLKSTDSGESWRPVGGDGLPEGASVVEVAQSDPRVVYAGALSESGVILFRSEDGGESWQARNG